MKTTNSLTEYKFETNGNHLTITHLNNRKFTVLRWGEFDDNGVLELDIVNSDFDTNDNNDVKIITDGVNLFLRQLLDTMSESKELQETIKKS